MILRNLHIDRSWSLFLDRDGVINQRRMDGYILNWSQFVFLPGVTGALNILSEFFGKIIIVTNQQGVGKGLMTVEDLDEIHRRFLEEVAASGGKIDKIYSCFSLEEENDNCRKPGTGMAELARKDFPEIDFKRSVMVGDSDTDIVFGKKLSMVTVYIDSSNLPGRSTADYTYKSLYDFASDLKKKIKQTD